MGRLVKIQSISDVITNSSSEVFCIKVTENFKKAFEGEDKLFFKIFLTEKDVREYLIKVDTWEIEDQLDNIPIMEYSPLSDYNLIETCDRIGKTREEIVDFFLPAYKCLIGYAIYNCEDTYNWDKLQNYIKENKDKDGEEISYNHY